MLDNQRMVWMMWMALIATVLVLLGLYIRQRTRIVQSQVNARELASLQALEEYNEQYEARAIPIRSFGETSEVMCTCVALR